MSNSSTLGSQTNSNTNSNSNSNPNSNDAKCEKAYTTDKIRAIKKLLKSNRQYALFQKNDPLLAGRSFVTRMWFFEAKQCLETLSGRNQNLKKQIDEFEEEYFKKNTLEKRIVEENFCAPIIAPTQAFEKCRGQLAYKVRLASESERNSPPERIANNKNPWAFLTKDEIEKELKFDSTKANRVGKTDYRRLGNRLYYYTQTEGDEETDCLREKRKVRKPAKIAIDLRNFENQALEAMKQLNLTLDDARDDVRAELPNIQDKDKMKDKMKVIDPKFGSGKMYVQPRVLGPHSDDNRTKEKEKKQRQRDQKKLLGHVLDNEGGIKAKYKPYFVLEYPFALGNNLRKDRQGRPFAGYDRLRKRIELQLRFRVEPALAHLKNLEKRQRSKTQKKDKNQSIQQKLQGGKVTNAIKALTEFQNNPHADLPLKLKKHTNGKYTVARGGDHVDRLLKKALRLNETKKGTTGSQHYIFTPNLNDPTPDQSIRGLTCPLADPNSNSNPCKHFQFKHLRQIADKILLLALRKIIDVAPNALTFTLESDLSTIDRIAIPNINQYKVILPPAKSLENDIKKLFASNNTTTQTTQQNTNNENTNNENTNNENNAMIATDRNKHKEIMFKPAGQNLNTRFFSNKTFTLQKRRVTQSVNQSVFSYKTTGSTRFKTYDETIKGIRQNIASKHTRTDREAAFYLRDEDRYRMSHIQKAPLRFVEAILSPPN